jgi:hypothetical protein
MPRPIRSALAVLLAITLTGGTGCGPDPNRPNPDLKVPPVPPGKAKEGPVKGQPGK